MRKFNVAIVGATGAVGHELLGVLERRKFPIGNLKLLASSRSVGKLIEFNNEAIGVEELTKDSFEGIDIAIFSAGSERAKVFAPAAVAVGAVVIDNSSAFRMDPKVPLVVPEINAEAIRTHSGIIANPNCTTIISLMPLYPLHKAFGLKRIAAASYQAVSGAGGKALDEYHRQVRQAAQGVPITVEALRHQILGNIIPEIGGFALGDHTTEEVKLVNEGRKIMSHPSFDADITCVRVPVARAHSVVISAEFDGSASPSDVWRVLKQAPGIKVLDNPMMFYYPMPLFVAGKDDCEVGRIRESNIFSRGVQFIVVGDQLLKGAALNAVQIAELLIKN